MNTMVRALTGILILLSLVLGYTQHEYAYALAAFVGVDYLLSIFTGKTLLEAVFSGAKPASSSSAKGQGRNKRRRDGERRERREESRSADAGSAEPGAESGTVKWFSFDKGFGFIVLDNGDEVFVHHRAINARGRRVLREGQQVTLDVIVEERGPQAQNVTVIGG